MTTVICSTLITCLTPAFLHFAAVEHRKQFASKRGGHYRNEAEAMKRAAAMLADEEDEGDNESGTEAAPVPPVPQIPSNINGA